MKKRLLSMLMAVLMIASLVPATALAAPVVDKHVGHDVLTVNITADPAKKQPGIEFEYCNSDSTKDHDVILKALEVTPFAEASDICLRHSTKTVELQAATCDKPSIKLTYCPVCGTAAADALQISWKNVGHSYTKFVVKQAPTCENEGWGYTVCDKCGEPELVVGYDAGVATDKFRGAEYYLYYGKEISDVTTAARDAVMKQFNPTNPYHENKDAFVTPTKDVYVDTWKVDELHGGEVGYVDSVLTYRAAVEPTHANTINGEAVVNEDGSVTVMPNNVASQTNYVEKDKKGNVIDGAGYSGDKYCPDCSYKVPGTDLKGLNEVHKMDLKQAGYAPYIDNKGIKHDGKTDVWTCRDCGDKDFGGKTIAYSAYYPNEGTRLPNVANYVEGDLFVLNKIAATCEVKGSTGETYKLVDGQWSKIEAAKETPALGHQLKKIESKAPTCTEIGWTCSNYYICTREGCDHHQGTAVAIPAIIHSNVYFSAANIKLVDIVAPTCKNTGLTAYVCTACNEVLDIAERVPAVPHTAGDPVNAKEATCTEEGYTGDLYCQWCNKLLEQGKTIEKKAHTPEDVAAVAATCTEAGATAGTKCSVCGEVLSGCEKIDALGHKYENGVCTVCGEKDPNYVEPVAPEFKDADSIKDYAKDAVAWAAKEGVVKGDDQGNFNPTANITRQDFVTMLWRLNGEVASDKELTFGDKADIKDYAQTAVAWAVENGYITGRDNGNFDPAAKITRAEIVAILNRVADNAKAEKAASFTDIGSHWAKDAIAWAAEAGIVNGVGNDLFAPNDNATRQDTVVMLYKFVNLK